MTNILALPVLPFYALGRHRRFAVMLLVLAVSVGPRVHMGRLQYGKLLDIRLEDMLVAALVASWVMSLVLRPRKSCFTPLAKPVALYLVLAFVSTLAGLFLGWIEPLRATFFYLKELEFFLIFFITVNFIRDERDLRAALLTVVAGGLLNGLFVLYQYITGRLGGMDDPTYAYRYYGVAMLGESSPGVTGNYFALTLFLSMALFVCVRERPVRAAAVLCALLSVLGVTGSMSRTSFLGAAAVLPLLVFLVLSLKQGRISRARLIAVLAPLFAVTVFFSISLLGQGKDEVPFAKRISELGKENIRERYYAERVEEVYSDYFKVIPMSPLIGLGKSITGHQEIHGVSLDNFYAEAHNQYLRVLVEMGVVGLAAFVYLVLSLAKYSYRVSRDAASYPRVAGLTCLIYVAFLLVTSMAQDVFIMTRTAGLLWMLAGLTMAAYGWKQRSA